MDLDELAGLVRDMDKKLDDVHGWQLKMNGTLGEKCPAHERRLGNLEKFLCGISIAVLAIAARVIIGGG